MENLLDSRRFYIECLPSYFVFHFLCEPNCWVQKWLFTVLGKNELTCFPITSGELWLESQSDPCPVSFQKCLSLAGPVYTRRYQELGRQISVWVSNAQVRIEQNSSFLLMFEVTIPFLKSFNYIYFIAGISTKC